MPRRRAFTMIELLVVMGIIVLLIAILMPALGKAREAANAVTCSSHIKNLTNAFLLFANDHNNHLPGTRRTWRGGDKDLDHQDWLFGIYSAWDEYPGNTMMQRIDCAPQYGTIWPYVKDYNVYKCPSMNVERPGSGIGSNGRFDYAAFSIFCGATVRSVRPISQLHRPCITRTVTTNAATQTTVSTIISTLPGPNMNDPNVKMDPMTVVYQNLGFAGAVENMPTPLVCQEEPGMSINYDPNGNVFVHHDNEGDDDWWSQMDGAHQHWDQMSHVHGGGSYYGAIDGSVVFVIEPDTDQWIGTWGSGAGQGVYGEGASLWWQKGPASNIPRALNWDPGAYQPDATNAPNDWRSGWNWWSRE